eukprot:TRINITY_DN6941_c0_g1_i1.p1 TRINITY_DN6941_c0_g1~~TRINITY_DN6941_c0_g1_i1.p1  ORF type:complete len:418 (-),score=74.02 TRINITY_DN6941_c0_g1_i1:274-1527(-)
MLRPPVPAAPRSRNNGVAATAPPDDMSSYSSTSLSPRSPRANVIGGTLPLPIGSPPPPPSHCMSELSSPTTATAGPWSWMLLLPGEKRAEEMKDNSVSAVIDHSGDNNHCFDKSGGRRTHSLSMSLPTYYGLEGSIHHHHPLRNVGDTNNLKCNNDRLEIVDDFVVSSLDRRSAGRFTDYHPLFEFEEDIQSRNLGGGAGGWDWANPSAHEFVPPEYSPQTGVCKISSVGSAEFKSPPVAASSAAISPPPLPSLGAPSSGVNESSPAIGGALPGSSRKRNMTQGRKEQRRRAMVRRAMRHLLEWPLDKQEKCNRNYGLLIIEVPEEDESKQSYVLPCKEVRKLCCCDQCSFNCSSSDENCGSTSNASGGGSQQQEVRAREISHAEDGVVINWSDGHSSQHSYVELKALHSQILNVSS